MNALSNLADSDRNRIRITDIKAMQLEGIGSQSLVKVETDAGVYGSGTDLIGCGTISFDGWRKSKSVQKSDFLTGMK